MIDLYELVARERAVRAEDLPFEERIALCEKALGFIEPTFEIVPGTGRDERDPIELVAYDPEWPARFEAWRRRIVAALPQAPRRIDHIGSTSISGMVAKPVVDIQLSVDDIEDEEAYVPAIESLGVQLRSRDREHRYFRPFSGRPREGQVHVCGAGTEWERRHLVFRDYLRANSEARRRYLEAKEAAAARWRDDRIAYTEAKSAIIRALTEEALKADARHRRQSRL